MNNKHLIPSALLIIIFLYSITGCVFDAKPIDENICKNFAICLEDETTSKEEILQLNLKQLYKTKNERIWIFLLPHFRNEGGNELVLVFDENGILKKHSLVKTW